MKKLFSLVLTLALVFAIAAPAMAATWGTGAAPTGSPFTVTVETYKVTSDALNPVVYAPLGNSAVVAGTPVAFKVTFTVPASTAVATYYKDMTGLTYEAGIDLTNLINLDEVTDASNIATDDPDGITIDTDPMAPGVTAKSYSVMYSATVASTAKALVEAYIGYQAFSDDDNDKKKGGGTLVFDDYFFSSNGVAKTVGEATIGIEFTLNDSGVVTGWRLYDGTNDYAVVSPTMFVQTSGAGAGTILTTGPAFEALNDIYKEFVAVLGFNVNSTGIYYTLENLIANYQPGGYAEAVGIFLPFTASLTVTDGTRVPNTGDNMSVIGFVMVALALLATAAVIVKKVRA